MIVTHLSPYPTIADLRYGTSFGAVDPATLFDQDVLAARDVKLAVHLKRLGLKIPQTPANMTAEQALIWGMLVNFDLMAGYLAVAYEQYALILALVGEASCEDLNRYNQLALQLYREQEKVVTALRAAGVKGGPMDPPFPNLFVAYGVNKGLDYQITCESGKTNVPAAPTDNSYGVRLQMQKPCPDLGAVPLVVGGLILGATAIIAYFGFDAWKEIAKTYAQVQISAQNTEKGRKMAEYLAARGILLRQMTQDCVAAGGDPVTCLTAAQKGLPKTIDALKKDAYKDPDKGWGFFTWLGVGVTALAVGGVVVWAVKRK